VDDLGPFNEAAGVFGRKGSFPSAFTPQKINGWNLTSDTPGRGKSSSKASFSSSMLIFKGVFILQVL